MNENKLDPETARLQNIAKSLKGLIEHEGWSIARDRLTTRILDLQNAFSIEGKTADEMFVDLRARKIASTILFEWLKDIEGTVDQIETNLPKEKELYIINLSEE